MERVFTLEEARALVPKLTALLTALQAAHRSLAADVRRDGGAAVSGNGSAAAASRRSGVEQDYLALVGQIDTLGVVVRDPQTGLVDFPATRGGEPIYLCWRLGEPDIGHWHPRDTGIAGRQPL